MTSNCSHCKRFSSLGEEERRRGGEEERRRGGEEERRRGGEEERRRGGEERGEDSKTSMTSHSIFSHPLLI